MDCGDLGSNKYHGIKFKLDLRPRGRHHARRVEDQPAIPDIDADHARLGSVLGESGAGEQDRKARDDTCAQHGRLLFSAFLPSTAKYEF